MLKLTIRFGYHETVFLLALEKRPQELLLLLLRGVRRHRGTSSRRAAINTPDDAKVAAPGNFINELFETRVRPESEKDQIRNTKHTMASWNSSHSKFIQVSTVSFYAETLGSMKDGRTVRRDVSW